MAALVKAGANYDDLVLLPENVVGELIDGNLYASTRPPGPCLRFTSALAVFIGPRYHLGINGPGGWWILDEPEWHIDHDVLVPALCGWRREHMPTVPEVFTAVPDWICETRIDRQQKLPIYARHGVPYVWIADSIDRIVEVLHLFDGRWIVLGSYRESDVFAAEPFPLAEIDLPLIWGALPPTT